MFIKCGLLWWYCHASQNAVSVCNLLKGVQCHKTSISKITHTMILWSSYLFRSVSGSYIASDSENTHRASKLGFPTIVIHYICRRRISAYFYIIELIKATLNEITTHMNVLFKKKKFKMFLRIAYDVCDWKRCFETAKEL